MYYTQVELTSEDGKTEVWWLPVPAGKAKVGEVITRKIYDQSASPVEDPFFYEEWTITAVCVTLTEEDLRSTIPEAKTASSFERESQTLAYMRM